MHEPPRGVVVTVQSACGTHPHRAVGITVETDDGIAAERGGVVALVQVSGEVVAVELVHTVVGGHPQIAVTVLAHIVDFSARKAV